MQPVPIHPGLSHRLLVAIARAHYDGAAPLDAQDLAAVGGHASAKAVNRAVGQLADAGLIEGVNTPAGWMAIRPTAAGSAAPVGPRGARSPRPCPPRSTLQR